MLILGGYGTFGSRLVRLLADEPRLTLLVAGRSRKKAERLVVQLPEARTALGVAGFDRNYDVFGTVRRLRPDIVVDCSGPFQAYGEDPYRIVRAAVGEGAHYLDLADAPGFVRGVAQFDAEAKRARVFVLSGASTAPALTAAVVRRLAENLPQIDSVAAGIAPSPRVRMGKAVIGAVASCAGRPVALRKGGAPATGPGLLDSREIVVAPPGVVPLPWVRFSLIDVPDLALLPEIFPQLRDVWFGAGVRPRLLHRMLNVGAWLARLRLLPPLRLFTPVMHACHAGLRWGEHRSGMFVRAEGRDAQGLRRVRTWHVLAEGDDGPFIPAMAAAALIARLLDGDPPPSGARPATADVTLADYEPQFAARAIATGVRDEADDADLARPLYARVLGSAWDALPPPIRALHDFSGATAAEGRARVERGRGPLARTIADKLGFPEAAQDVPVRVDFSAQGGVETWTRAFGRRSFSSTQSAGQDRDFGLIVERFGPLEFLLALKVETLTKDDGGALSSPLVGEGKGWGGVGVSRDGAERRVGRGDGAATPAAPHPLPPPHKGEGESAAVRLRLIVRGWRAFGLPMPAVLAPNGEAFEHAEGGRFNFDVELKLPLIGLLVRYRGWLEPTQEREPAAAAETAEVA